MKTKLIQIGDHLVGEGKTPFIIAEVAQAHDGSLGMAHAFIDAAAEAKANAVKFQTHIAHAESTLDEPFRATFSYEDASRYGYWKRMEFKKEQWAGLAEHTRERGLVFLSSPFSVEAVELLSGLGMEAWKIGSGETNNPLLLESIFKTGKPIILSTGMSRMEEIQDSINRMEERDTPFALLQCTSSYPTPMEKVGLNVLKEFRERFRSPVGLSDHSGSIFPSLAALALGAELIEVHVTFHRKMFGPDVSSSLTFEDLRLVTKGAEAIHTMRVNPVDKDLLAAELNSTKSMFNKSLALNATLPKGTLLKEKMLTLKKPGTGIPFRDRSKVIGKRLKRKMGPDVLLTWDDLE